MPRRTNHLPRALIVLGSPRSGTTLLGNYLGSSPAVLNLGEYGGFHLAHNIARSTLGAIPGPFRDLYLADLALHAQRFAEGLTREQGRTWYCDATPWNLLSADVLDKQLGDALFVLILRHYSGTVQSLRRSFEGGFAWAGATWAESAGVWATCYACVAGLPPDRTIAISYEQLAAQPGATLALLRTRLEEAGFDCDSLDAGQLAISHAPPRAHGARPTIGTVGPGGVQLRPIPSFEAEAWSDDIQAMVWPVVEGTHRELKRRFEGVYQSPPQPRNLRAKDGGEGLVAVELGNDW